MITCAPVGNQWHHQRQDTYIYIYIYPSIFFYLLSYPISALPLLPLFLQLLSLFHLPLFCPLPSSAKKIRCKRCEESSQLLHLSFLFNVLSLPLF